MRLNCSPIANVSTGYGNMTHELYGALDCRGVLLTAPPDPNNDCRPQAVDNLWMGLPSHVKGWYEGQRNHVLTMWEGSRLPPGFRAELSEFDTVIVPSQQNVELFSEYHDNVHRVPLGVNPQRWKYTERQAPGTHFRFLAAGRGSRKSIDVAIKAFNMVFGDWKPRHDYPIPTLIVKGTAPQNRSDGPHIREIAGILTPQEEVDLYADAHCFLGLSRGEGWGLMPFQAMAQGCPTILSDAHGHREYGYLTPHTLVSTKQVEADPFVFGDAGEWWEPDLQEVCALMWDVFLNWSDYLPQAKHAAEVIADEYTWDHSAARLVDLIQPDDDTLSEFTWHHLTQRVYHIVTTRDCAYEVNGVAYQFDKGKDYWEYADLKRIMYEHGVLDMVCIDEADSGLLPAQLSNAERYRAQHAFCKECGQRLNSDPSLAFDDQDFVELLS